MIDTSLTGVSTALQILPKQTFLGAPAAAVQLDPLSSAAMTRQFGQPKEKDRDRSTLAEDSSSRDDHDSAHLAEKDDHTIMSNLDNKGP